MFHLLDADFDAVFREDHVLLLHFVGCRIADLSDGEVYLVADVGQAGEEEEEDYQGEECPTDAFC
jgi:hypothetical protein